MYFSGLRGRQTQGPPRAAHTLATPLHRLASRSTLQAMNGAALRSSLKFVYYLTNVPKMIRRCHSR